MRLNLPDLNQKHKAKKPQTSSSAPNNRLPLHNKILHCLFLGSSGSVLGRFFLFLGSSLSVFHASKQKTSKSKAWCSLGAALGRQTQARRGSKSPSTGAQRVSPGSRRPPRPLQRSPKIVQNGVPVKRLRRSFTGTRFRTSERPPKRHKTAQDGPKTATESPPTASGWHHVCIFTPSKLRCETTCDKS